MTFFETKARPLPARRGVWLRAVAGLGVSLGMLVAGVNVAGAAVIGPGVSSTPQVAAAADPSSFWLATPAGDVQGFGSALSYGSLSGTALAKPIMTVAPTPSGKGYWLAASDGGIFAFGDATFFGSTGAIHLSEPIVGMTATPTGKGYWLVASDGGIFAFGDAAFFGSTGAIKLHRPIVGMATTPDGSGYWLVASDGGIFSFGSARFFGSTGAITLAQPIVAMTPTTVGDGYMLLAADGGLFNFGSAQFHGSMGGAPTLDPAEKVVPTKTGKGYWIIDQNGTNHPFGDASGNPPAVALMFKPDTLGDVAVSFAFTQLGKPYIWGGNGPVGYDCSGLVLASWTKAGKSFARIANDEYHTAGAPIPLDQLQAGDLVFWGASDWQSVYHAGMYVGGGRIVESTGDHVQLNSLGQWGTSDLMPHGVRPA